MTSHHQDHKLFTRELEEDQEEISKKLRSKELEEVEED
jgi:hypothetical protein